MTASIFSIIFGIISVITLVVSYYFQAKSKLREGAEKAIVIAETLDAIGEVKLAAAIEMVYELVPPIFKPIFTKEQIKLIVQTSFDKIKEYYVLKQKQSN